MNKRPVNLNLTTIHMPIVAVSSILHRISGFILFFFIPLSLWLLSVSLSSAQGFESVAALFASPWLKFVVWGMLSALVYHLFAGIKHLVMDFGWVHESLCVGRFAAALSIMLSIVVIISMGVWLW